jgi:hypothetical protein
MNGHAADTTASAAVFRWLGSRSGGDAGGLRVWRAEQKWTELNRAKVDFFTEVPIALASAA